MRNFKARIGLGRHLMTAACLLFVLAATTSAYSIVMRGGKRIEIPAQFSVTNMTLTYEAAPGFWITLQMAAVDIPATERANNEKPGSLLGRATQGNSTARTSERTSQAPGVQASRSVTNRDLRILSALKTGERARVRAKTEGTGPSSAGGTARSSCSGR